jgi:hypothetical protein
VALAPDARCVMECIVKNMMMREGPLWLTYLCNNNKHFLLLNCYLIGLRSVALVLSTENTIQLS